MLTDKYEKKKRRTMTDQSQLTKMLTLPEESELLWYAEGKKKTLSVILSKDSTAYMGIPSALSPLGERFLEALKAALQEDKTDEVRASNQPHAAYTTHRVPTLAASIPSQCVEIAWSGCGRSNTNEKGC